MAIHKITVSLVRWNRDKSEAYALDADGNRVHFIGIRFIRAEHVGNKGLIEMVNLYYDDLEGSAKIINYGRFARHTIWQRLRRDILQVFDLITKTYKAFFGHK